MEKFSYYLVQIVGIENGTHFHLYEIPTEANSEDDKLIYHSRQYCVSTTRICVEDVYLDSSQLSEIQIEGKEIEQWHCRVLDSYINSLHKELLSLTHLLTAVEKSRYWYAKSNDKIDFEISFNSISLAGLSTTLTICPSMIEVLTKTDQIDNIEAIKESYECLDKYEVAFISEGTFDVIHSVLISACAFAVNMLRYNYKH